MNGKSDSDLTFSSVNVTANVGFLCRYVTRSRIFCHRIITADNRRRDESCVTDLQGEYGNSGLAKSLSKTRETRGRW